MIETSLFLISGVSTAIDALSILKTGNSLFQYVMKNGYLNYDFCSLKRMYSKESLIDKNILYTELFNSIDNPDFEFQIKCKKSDFRLDHDNDIHIEQFCSDAVKEFITSGKMNKNDSTVRLDRISVENRIVTLTVSKAQYADQVKTHLVLDWENKHLKKIGLHTYRGFLTSKYNGKLPPLNSKYLPNSIGISIILYYKVDGVYIPYITHRNKSHLNKKKNEPALNEGYYSSSASGVLEWNSKISIDSIKDEMYREIKEEIGLEREDLLSIDLLSICRELLRAGKPQFFFIGFINLTEKEIINKRIKAIKQNKIDKSQKVEIREKVLNAAEIKDNKFIERGSFELMANLFYSEIYCMKKVRKAEKLL